MEIQNLNNSLEKEEWTEELLIHKFTAKDWVVIKTRVPAQRNSRSTGA